jgi:signal transduction histidine kinase
MLHLHQNTNTKIQQASDVMQTSSALERKVQILTRLAEISAGLNSTLKLKPLLSNIMDATVEITESEAASVLLWDHKNNELRFAATTAGPASANLIGQAVPLEGSIAGTVMLENRIMMVNNVEDDPRHYTKVDETISFQTRSILGVPMTSKNRLIGVLEAVNKQSPWTTDDCNYVSILAAQAAVAIEGAQLVAQLQKAYEELSQVDKLKNDFIAIASHELRTPLGVILGYATFLQETHDLEVAGHAEKVVNSALQLRRIIEDLTNLRYIQSGEGDLNRERITVAELFRDLEHEFRSLVGATKHDLRFLPPPAEAVIIVDRIRMVMAIMNLINNAVRFTPEGGKILIQCEMRSPHLTISITDTGIGFEKDQTEKIFEKFYQVEDHMTRRHGGLGIGLSITKALIEAHGGRIWAQSPGINQGSTFTIIMPAAT